MTHLIKTILATAGLNAFPKSVRGTPVARAQKLCEHANTPYFSKGTMRHFASKVHKLEVVAHGAAFVALESFSQDDPERLYRPTVIDCAGNVADHVSREDCTTDRAAADKWFAEKVRAFSNDQYSQGFVKAVIERETVKHEYVLKHLKRGLVLLTGQPLEMFTVNNDSNGNARYVVHYLDLLTQAQLDMSVDLGVSKYAMALGNAKRINGRKFHNKQFGGGIVFSCCSRSEIAEMVSRVTGHSFYAE